MFHWLDRLSDESHASHRTAAHYHMWYVVTYGALIGLYVGAIAFHWAAARRHRKDARCP